MHQQRKRLTRVDNNVASSTDSSPSEAPDDEGSEYELEPWNEFLTRVTHLAEERAKTAGLQEWLTAWRGKQWRWARKVVTGDSKKWSNTSLHWSPQLHTSRVSVRAQARPKKRWTDDVQGYLDELNITQPWKDVAKIEEIWADLEPGFLTWDLTFSRHAA